MLLAKGGEDFEAHSSIYSCLLHYFFPYTIIHAHIIISMFPMERQINRNSYI